MNAVSVVCIYLCDYPDIEQSYQSCATCSIDGEDPSSTPDTHLTTQPTSPSPGQTLVINIKGQPTTSAEQTDVGTSQTSQAQGHKDTHHLNSGGELSQTSPMDNMTDAPQSTVVISASSLSASLDAGVEGEHLTEEERWTVEASDLPGATTVEQSLEEKAAKEEEPADCSLPAITIIKGE